jgi:septal ring factor EnvC (AmiA/AmiB activator)
MKVFRGILAALAVTTVVAVSMFVIGTNALANKDSVPIVNSPQSNVANISVQTSNAQTAQTAQLQNLIAQYQNREKQYQQELQQAADQLNQANQQLSQSNQTLQQYQQLFSALQQRGIIRVDSNGQIFIPRGGFGEGN